MKIERVKRYEKRVYARIRDFSITGTKRKKHERKNNREKLRTAVKALDGIPLKVTAANYDGMPDRIVLLPRGKIAFIELKAPGKVMRPLQERRKRQLEGLGFSVFCIDGIEQIGGILNEIQGI